MSVAQARLRRRGALGTRALAGASLVLRRLRFEPAAAATMFALVAATCFLFAALPRLFNRAADDGLRHVFAHAPLTDRNVRAIEPGRLAATVGADPLANVVRGGVRAQQQLPAPVRELVERRTFLVSSPRYVDARALPGLVRNLTLRVQGGVRSHVRLVAGRFPSTTSRRVRAVVRPAPGLPKREEVVPLLEVALSTTTARRLRLHVGDREILVPDASVTYNQQVPVLDQQPLAVEVAGLFVVKDPRTPFWFGDSTLAVPDEQSTQDLQTTFVYGQALVSPLQYAALLAATRPFLLTYEHRYFLATGRVDAARLQSLRDASADLETRYAGAGPLDPQVQIGLGDVLDRYRAMRSQAETMLAVGVIGLLACALANIGLLGALSYDRRRREAGVSRVRGASPRQVLAAQAVEAVLVAVPAGLVGWAVAELTVRGRGSSFSIWLVLAVVAATVLLLTAAVADVARRPLGQAARDDVVLARPSPRRLALEGLVAVVAGLGVFLLRRRGLETSSSGSAKSFDPYLAAVPVLLCLACGIVALRLYPILLDALTRLARRGRGLVLHLGLSRAARQPDIAAAPLLVLLLALAVASFSAAMLSTLHAGQDRTGWRTVGADARVDAAAGERLPDRLASRLDSLGEVAVADVQDTDLSAGSQTRPASVVALDVPAYERVVAGTPAASSLEILRRSAPLPGTVPAVVSTNWPVAGSFQVDFRRHTVTLVPVASAESFPGIPLGAPFALTPLAPLERVTGELAPNRIYLGGASDEALRRVLHDTAPRATFVSRASVVRSLRSSPLVDRVLRGYSALIVLAFVCASIAVMLQALIAARTRARDLALVRTMGGAPSEAVYLAAVELAPFVVVALALGIGLGVVIPYLIAPGLELSFFTGSDSNPIAIPWQLLALFAFVLLALVGVSSLLVGVRARRANLDRVLRLGER